MTSLLPLRRTELFICSTEGSSNRSHGDVMPWHSEWSQQACGPNRSALMSVAQTCTLAPEAEHGRQCPFSACEAENAPSVTRPADGAEPIRDGSDTGEMWLGCVRAAQVLVPALAIVACP